MIHIRQWSILNLSGNREKNMATNLSPENEQFIQNAIAAGMYHNREEVLDRAVDLLKRREQLIRDVNLGIEQLENGLGETLDIEQIKASVRSGLK